MSRIRTFDAGEAFGWSWLFPPYRWYFDAHTHQVTDAGLVFPAQTLRILTQDCSRLLACQMSWISPTTFPPTLTEVLGVTLTTDEQLRQTTFLGWRDNKVAEEVVL